MFGIGKVRFFAAEGLDIAENNAALIMAGAKNELSKL